jgi:NADPH:quinone reductase-like Zn-dependent oxidoreductase
MASTSNKVLYVDEGDNVQIRNGIKHEEIAADELIIEMRYLGVNPADTKHAQLGIRSTVIEYDFFGTVLSAPTGSHFKKGSFVAGYTPSGIGRPLKYGAHQSRLACPDDMIFEQTQCLSYSSSLYPPPPPPLPPTPALSWFGAPLLVLALALSSFCVPMAARISW